MDSKTEHNMEHMRHLSKVVESDLAILRYKESTYQGSWKRSGGRSAWFMVKRMIDRLVSMMAKPETPATFNLQNIDDTIRAIANAQPIEAAKIDAPVHHRAATVEVVDLPGTPSATADLLNYLRNCYTAENIFEMIRSNPSGADGTVLAILRDTRRYAILIEAEMIARGVVEVERVPASLAAPSEPAQPVPAPGWSEAEELKPVRPSLERMARITKVEYEALDKHSAMCYTRRAADVFVLSDTISLGVWSGLLDTASPLSQMYKKISDDGALLRRDMLPQAELETRERWARERNQSELDALHPVALRSLYTWVDGKYVMDNETAKFWGKS